MGRNPWPGRFIGEGTCPISAKLLISITIKSNQKTPSRWVIHATFLKQKIAFCCWKYIFPGICLQRLREPINITLRTYAQPLVSRRKIYGRAVSMLQAAGKYFSETNLKTWHHLKNHLPKRVSGRYFGTRYLFYVNVITLEKKCSWL